MYKKGYNNHVSEIYSTSNICPTSEHHYFNNRTKVHIFTATRATAVVVITCAGIFVRIAQCIQRLREIIKIITNIIHLKRNVTKILSHLV